MFPEQEPTKAPSVQITSLLSSLRLTDMWHHRDDHVTMFGARPTLFYAVLFVPIIPIFCVCHHFYPNRKWLGNWMPQTLRGWTHSTFLYFEERKGDYQWEQRLLLINIWPGALRRQLELYNELFKQHSDVFIHLLYFLVFPKRIRIHNGAVFIYWSFLFVDLVSWLADLTVFFPFLAVELQLDLCTLHFLFFILLSWVIFPFIRTWYGILFSIHRVYCYFLMNLFKSCGFFKLDACKLSSSVTFFLLHF